MYSSRDIFSADWSRHVKFDLEIEMTFLEARNMQ
jgi:hypothetical protein